MAESESNNSDLDSSSQSHKSDDSDASATSSSSSKKKKKGKKHKKQRIKNQHSLQKCIKRRRKLKLNQIAKKGWLRIILNQLPMPKGLNMKKVPEERGKLWIVVVKNPVKL